MAGRGGPRPIFTYGRPGVPPLRFYKGILESLDGRVLDPPLRHKTYLYRLFGKARRTNGTAPVSIFAKARAQWPDGNLDPPLRFCAPELFCLAQGVTPVNGVRGKATMSTKCSSGAGPYPLCPFGTSPLDKGSRPRGVLPNPSLLPAKPSEAGSPGRGGARERTQFSPPGGNGVEWTLRRRAAMGKVGRRPQAAKSPMKRSPLRSGHRVVAQASFFDPAGQFIFSHPAEKPNLSFPARLFLTTPERKI